MRRPHLDGLRFPLFIVIFSGHLFGFVAQYLDYALSTFFVLSGFVVTTVLINDREPSLFERIKAFYLRRIIRVFPAYYFALALLAIFTSVTFPLYYLFHAVNIKLFLLSIAPDHAANHQWLIANWRPQSLHMWSLGVEEQFYLFYPLLLLLTPVARRIPVLLAVVVISIVTRLWLASAFPESYYGAILPVQMEYLAWGGIFAILTQERKLSWLRAFPTVAVSAGVVVAIVVLESLLGTHSSLPFQPTVFQTPVAFLLGLFIWGLWNLPPGHRLARILGFGPIAYLGSLSFGLYLVHLMSWDIYTMLRGGNASPADGASFFAGTMTVTVLISIGMWHFVEKPTNELRRYVGRRDRRGAKTIEYDKAAVAALTLAPSPAQAVAEDR